MKINLHKSIVTAILGILIAILPITAQVVDASIFGAILQGAAVNIYLNRAIKNMDEHGQAERLSVMQEQTGVLNNPSYETRIAKIAHRLSETKLVKRDYAVYVTPEEDYNAFMAIGRVMAVNKGTMDLLDDDELAYVMAHEFAHGEKYHVRKGIRKKIALSTAVSVGIGDSSTAVIIVANIANDYINNEMFTLPQEEEADDYGYYIMTEAGYNPGAPAAAMAEMYEKYGDHYREGLSRAIMPNNHPKTSDRITENIKRMKKYSNGHVDVKMGVVYINGEAIYKPLSKGKYTSDMRAYLMAGKIAKLYHDNKKFNLLKVNIDGNVVKLNGKAIVSTESFEEATIVAEKMRIAIATKVPEKINDTNLDKSEITHKVNLLQNIDKDKYFVGNYNLV